MARANLTEAELDQRHAEKMRRKKEARDKIIATKTIEKGLTIVHTGKGKGKSTAAFGLVLRALGNGMKVAIVQFVKGKWETGGARCARTVRRPGHDFDDGRGFYLGDPGPSARYRRGPRSLGTGERADPGQ